MSKSRMNPQEVPQRFFGPVGPDLAERLTEMALDDVREALLQFLTGQIDPREFMYRIQILMEANEQRMQEPEGFYGDSGVA